MIMSKMKTKFCVVGCFVVLTCTMSAVCSTRSVSNLQGSTSGHPRLYFNSEQLKKLRSLRDNGVHAMIWRNLKNSADSCMQRPLRKKWIAPVTPDPNYENLYDRFYAMMHDMSVMEHMAFAYAYSGEKKYFDNARDWLLACSRIWVKEAKGEPDQNKAYAVTRVLKGIAVSYDLLYNDLNESDRDEVRQVLIDVGDKYYKWYVANPGMAGPEQNKHHGSVEAASFGVVGLALYHDYEGAKHWVDLMVKKHKEFLLPQGLTPAGNHEQSSNYWASTMQYRIMFMDALKRVTGQNLFDEFKDSMKADIALAAIAAGKDLGYNQNNQSVLFGPSYGQLDYWSPVLLYLAREYNNTTYQHIALRDKSLGSLQETRYITPSNNEQLLFSFGGYVYAWYDRNVKPKIESGLPLSFMFPTAEETYVRNSYRNNDFVAGLRRGYLIVHDGTGPVICEIMVDKQAVGTGKDITLSDDGKVAIIKCGKDVREDVSATKLVLNRPDSITIERESTKAISFWSYQTPKQKDNILTWPNGVRIEVQQGRIESIDPKGYLDEKTVGLGKLKCNDPMPMKYPLVKIAGIENKIKLRISKQ